MARSRVAQRLGLRLGLESEGEEYNEDAVLNGEDTVEGELLEVAEAQEEVEGDEEAIDELEEAADGLGEVAETVEASMEDGGLSPQAARFMQLAVESYTGRLGVDAPVVTSMESFGGTSGRLSATQVSLEGIKEFLKEIWAKVKSLIMSLRAKAKNLWLKLFDTSAKLAKRAEAIKKKAQSTTGSASEKKIEVNLKPIHLGGKAPTSMTGALEAVSQLVKAQLGASNDEIVKDMAKRADKLEQAANDPAAYTPDVASTTGFSSTYKTSSDKRFGDNVAVLLSDELPGGRMLARTIPSTAKTADEVYAARRGYFTSFSEKEKEVDTAEVNTLALSDIEKVCDICIEIASRITDYRKGWEKREKEQNEIVKAGDKLEKTSAKDDELPTDKKTAIRNVVRAANAQSRFVVGVIDGSATYAITTANAFLNVAAKSLAQYK
jgi:hypothetical protein